jgi:hypothetical protein
MGTMSRQGDGAREGRVAHGAHDEHPDEDSYDLDGVPVSTSAKNRTMVPNRPAPYSAR